MKIPVMTDILAKNNQIARDINLQLAKRQIFTLNLMGSPGSGKTSLLEQTIAGLAGDLNLAVIEGDLFTDKDAARIRSRGTPVVQINTRGGCHLDASMLEQAISSLPLEGLDILIIENVGNLVCPADFALGEDCRATVLSITEGDDKPLKYPLIFKRSSVIILNKIDLLPYTSFDRAQAIDDIISVSPAAKVLEVSCRSGEGISAWLDWLYSQVKRKKKRG